MYFTPVIWQLVLMQLQVSVLCTYIWLAGVLLYGLRAPKKGSGPGLVQGESEKQINYLIVVILLVLNVCSFTPVPKR